MLQFLPTLLDLLRQHRLHLFHPSQFRLGGKDHKVYILQKPRFPVVAALQHLAHPCRTPVPVHKAVRQPRFQLLFKILQKTLRIVLGLPLQALQLPLRQFQQFRSVRYLRQILPIPIGKQPGQTQAKHPGEPLRLLLRDYRR